jgi:hypothetical protein
MPKPRSKDLNEKSFTKRRTVDAGLRLADAAHAATWRLYCDVLEFWRTCRTKRCRRYRRCDGEPAGCLMRGLPTVPPDQQLAAAAEVIKGGPRRRAPATHMEWLVRRQPLPQLTAWPAASRPSEPRSMD